MVGMNDAQIFYFKVKAHNWAKIRDISYTAKKAYSQKQKLKAGKRCFGLSGRPPTMRETNDEGEK